MLHIAISVKNFLTNWRDELVSKGNDNERQKRRNRIPHIIPVDLQNAEIYPVDTRASLK